MRKAFSLVIAMCCLLSTFTFAQSGGGGGGGSGWIFQPEVLTGITAHNEIQGLQGVLYVFGSRISYLGLGSGARLMSGFLYQRRHNDRVYTFDTNVRLEGSSKIPVFLDFGAHYSNFILKLDYDGNSYCVQDGCQTDKGKYFGFFLGGGLSLPFGSLPLRLSMRIYQNPQFWLLSDISIGF
jgi:hypothetical protein